MRSLSEKIKNRFSNCTALQWQSIALGLACFAFMFLIRYKGVWNWDDVAYLKNIVRGLPSDLLLGRPGFMYPFIWLWWIVKSFGVSFYFIEDTIRIAGIFFLTGAYVLLFRLMVALKFSTRVSLLTVLFLLSELSFSIISSRITDSAMMYLCIMASYYFFVRAHQTQNFKKLVLAAFFFAYAFLTREPALIHFPFYLVLLIYFYNTKETFRLKEYILAAALFLAVCIVPVILMSLYYGSYYTETLRFSSSSAYRIDVSDLLIKADTIVKTHVNYILLPVALAGLVILFKRSGWRFSCGLLATCLIPLTFIMFFPNNGLVMEPRLFMGFFFMVALGAAYLIDAVGPLIANNRYLKVAITTAAVVIMYVSGTRFLPQYRADIAQIQYLENYYESIKPLINKDVVIIIGEETLYVGYRGQVEGIGPYFISPGWSWPTGKLVEKLNKALSENLTVIYDPQGRKYLEAKRAKDLDEMAATFNLTETKNGFIQVTLKK